MLHRTPETEEGEEAVNKVYVVSTGEYSDYSIHSIWSTKEKADRMKDILGRGRYNVADVFEMEIDKPQEEKPGFAVLIDLTTGEAITKGKYGNEYPIPCVLDDGNPRTSIYNCEYDLKYFKHEGKWCKQGYDGGPEPILIYSQHHSIDKAYKSARDLRAVELAKLENI